MKKQNRELPVHSFESAGSLRECLMEHHAESDGIGLKDIQEEFRDTICHVRRGAG
jgi:hypothetical protein